MILVSDGCIDYSWALKAQESLLQARSKDLNLPDLFWTLSHPATFTLGSRRTSIDNLIHPENIPVYAISRGGDVTYHDPGQLVGYLILYLRPEERDLHRVLYILEEAVIMALSEFSVQGRREAGKTGVFVGDFKVCSIGIACRHWITWHGLALNLNSELSNYHRINPCGLNPQVMANVGLSEQRTDLSVAIHRHLCNLLGRTVDSDRHLSINEVLQRFGIDLPPC